MADADAGLKLQECVDEYWEYYLRQNPLFATYIGDHRYDDRIGDISDESLAAQSNYCEDLSGRLKEIEERDISPEDRLNLRILKRTLSDHVRLYHFKAHYIALNHLTGPHIDFPQIVEYHPFRTSRDLENYLKRLNAFPVLVEQVIGNLQRGVREGYTVFQKSMGYVMAQVKTFTEFSPEEHPLAGPISKLNENFTREEREQTGKSVNDVIIRMVTPAYVELYRYLKDEYLGHCRQQAGVWSLPGGDDMYRFHARYHTTTDLSPAEIHETGKDEVERISAEIGEAVKAVGFKGSEREFARYLRDKKDLYPVTGQEIIEGFRNILSAMDRRLPDFFGRLPRARYDIRKIEEYREQAAPAAYYYPPPRDFSRPGYFYVNTYKPEQRPKFVMEALAFHEAVPGHHLQIALMQEQKDIPDFRRYQGSTAFIEGWALYAEKLAGEMGFYRDSYSGYGRLTFEKWRAVRLVVDTGIHFHRWSRDEAVRYCREQTGLEDHETEVEVDRYVVLPGQALAYKIGELKILELREKIRRLLGPGFDIRKFHDRLLEHGALPLCVLDNIMTGTLEKGS
jgi:uncharacterized protein (DUF885 family)